MAFSSHEAYFASVSPEVRPLLSSIQARIESLLPECSRSISYNMPAFKAERVFFYFAAFKTHIGIYPPVKQGLALVKALASYRGEKGNLLFSLGEPLPLDLIGRVAVALHRERGSK